MISIAGVAVGVDGNHHTQICRNIISAEIPVEIIVNITVGYRCVLRPYIEGKSKTTIVNDGIGDSGAGRIAINPDAPVMRNISTNGALIDSRVGTPNTRNPSRYISENCTIVYNRITIINAINPATDITTNPISCDRAMTDDGAGIKLTINPPSGIMCIVSCDRTMADDGIGII